MLSGRFTLHSGRTSDTYFDKYQFECDPKLLAAIAAQMVSLIPDGTEILAGLEMGGIPIVTALSRATGLCASFVRKEAKLYGTCRYAEGPEMSGKTVVLVEDVVSSGRAILEALTKLNKDGVRPEFALCVIDRQNGASEALKKKGVELRALYSIQDIKRAADVASRSES